MGILSKVIGVFGGYVVGFKVLIDYLCYKGCFFLFSIFYLFVVMVVCIEVIDVLLEELEYMEKFWDNMVYFKDKLV